MTRVVEVDTTPAIGFAFNDGGRTAAGFSGRTGDCVARAIAIAHYGAHLPGSYDLNDRDAYVTACALIEQYAAYERPGSKRRRNKRSSYRTGVWKPTTRRILSDLGWSWRPKMAIGGGCTTHLRAAELPSGRIICQLTRHICAVVDGVVHDIYDPSRAGTRCVYGYWYKPAFVH